MTRNASHNKRSHACHRLISLTAMIACFAVSSAPASTADVDAQIINYRAYGATFASAGQPSADQLAALADAGLQRVVYLAFSDHKNSLEHEDRVVKALGLDYIHIPVDWHAPQKRAYYQFARAMQADPARSTLLHCQVNFRASAFAFLYRVLHMNVSVADAKRDMNSVWTPDATWTALILEVLKENDIDPGCRGCDWTPARPPG